MQFKCQVICNRAEKIKYKMLKKGGKRHYHIGVWLDESDVQLNEVDRVIYRLHSSFKNSERSSESRSNKFSITFWTWGQFNIEAAVHYKDESVDVVDYYLDYSLPIDDGDNYVNVGKIADEIE